MHDLRDNIFNKIYATARNRIEALNPKSINKSIIEKAIDESLSFLNMDLNYPFKDTILNELLITLTVKSTSESIITDNPDHEEWYDKTKPRPYWNTYREYLREDLRLSIEGVNAIDNTTDLILKNIENPERKGIWDSRGLVVGSVQSGKTANFIGVLNKAVDAGYKMIVILSGLNNNLRQQTQLRIDEGLLGYDSNMSDDTSFIYKGPLFKKREPLKLGKPPICFTNSAIDGDLKSKIAKQSRNIHVDHPTVFVCKKNVSILTSLIKYFALSPDVTGVKIDDRFKKLKKLKLRKIYGGEPPFIPKTPILVIDDEVDNGSVDTGEQDYDDGIPDENYNPRRVNSLIRQLLHIFEKKVYIGYTATPFANIFIHHLGKTKEEGLDLFPKNFIVDLPLPSNHIGLEKLFPTEIVDGGRVEDREVEDNHFFEIINDHSLYPEDPDCNLGWMPPIHGIGHRPLYNSEEDPIPPSLQEAIISFILTCSCRNWRGQLDSGKSMLIHVSKFNNVQEIVFEQVYNFIESLQKNISQNTNKKNETLEKFRKIWEQKFYNKKEISEEKYPAWKQLLDHNKSFEFVIGEIAKNMKLLNSRSDHLLNYQDYLNNWGWGMQTIVIGGNKLSRGLTIDGLCISYFLRSAKMPAYDVLMQMGRWFGYRSGFEDLCKLYATRNMFDWFFQISVATEELRNDFRIMSSQNSTPREFGLRVQQSSSLLITSKTKMRHARKQRVSFSSDVTETVTFIKDEKVIKSNLKAAEKLLNIIGKPNQNGKITTRTNTWTNSYLWNKVESKKVIEFLEKYKRFADPRTFPAEMYAKYIKKANENGELTDFTVCLFGYGQSRQSYKFAKKYDVNLLLRTPSKTKNNKKISLKVISSPKEESIDLTDEEWKQYEKSLNNFKKINNKDEDEKGYESVARQYIRHHRSPTRGLLNLYPILGIINKNSYDEYKGYKDKNGKKISGHYNIDNIKKDHFTKIPLTAFQLSLSKSRQIFDNNSVLYHVNTIYREKEFNDGGNW